VPGGCNCQQAVLIVDDTVFNLLPLKYMIDDFSISVNRNVIKKNFPHIDGPPDKRNIIDDKIATVSCSNGVEAVDAFC